MKTWPIKITKKGRVRAVTRGKSQIIAMFEPEEKFNSKSSKEAIVIIERKSNIRKVKDTWYCWSTGERYGRRYAGGGLG